MKQLVGVSVLVAQLLLAGLSGAASKDEGKSTDIKVEVGKVSEVVFPQKIVKVIKGGQPDSVLVEVLDRSIYLLPKTDTPANIFVTTSSGSSYPLTLHIAQERDIKLHVGSSNRETSYGARNVYNDVMDLMKDLLLQREPAMATRLPSKGEVFLDNQQIKLTVEHAYELREWRAYVLKAQNLMNNAVIVPIEQIALPNLLAVSTDRDMLSARGQEGDHTKVYVIVGQ